MATTVVRVRGGGGVRGAVEQDVRRLVARELHDRVAQTLTGMLVDVENFKGQQVGWDDVIAHLDTIQGSTRQVLTSLRQLLHDLRGEEELRADFVDSLAGALAKYQEKTGIHSQLEVKPGWPEVLSPSAWMNLYRIVEEALANVKSHSRARTVSIVLEPVTDGEVSILITDDGRGVDTDPTRPVGLGTLGMKERALILGGRLSIENETKGGTTVRGNFPKDHITPVEQLSAPSQLIGSLTT